MKTILIVDDEVNHRLMLKLHLSDLGYDCIEAENGFAAYSIMQDVTPDIVLLDITMKIMDGLTLLNKIRQDGIVTPVIIITAHTDVKTAVSAMKIGATDFVTKPVKIDELVSNINNLLSDIEHDILNIPKVNYKFGGVYSNEGMKSQINLLSMVSPTDATVLILGESGTGKELIARSIHENSKRKDKPFIAVNCAAMNDNLIESELFGHVKGAFTGAVASRVGRFGEADGGTIFLDEIGEVPLATQTKLLRVLQEKTYDVVGTSKSTVCDVRVIAATNKDIKSLSETGEFRNDLYFRLSVFPITIPPLRERLDDIPLLVNFFIDKYAIKFGKNIKSATERYIKRLQDYSFPGNIRELENIVERSLILSNGDKLDIDTLTNLSTYDTSLSLEDSEKQNIIDAIKRSNGNKTKSAKLLGISRRSLYYKMQEYGLE